MQGFFIFKYPGFATHCYKSDYMQVYMQLRIYGTAQLQLSTNMYMILHWGYSARKAKLLLMHQTIHAHDPSQAHLYAPY